jgi:hypothetical protein
MVHQKADSDDEILEAAIQYVSQAEEVVHALATNKRPWRSRIAVDRKFWTWN